MGGFGWHNGFPFEWGGGPTDTELLYLALRSAVGEGGSSDADDTIEDLWRQARAIGLSAAEEGNLRASLQALPSKATDALPYYEEVLGAPPEPGDSDVARRARVTERWIATQVGDLPDLLTSLQVIDPTFALPAIDTTQFAVTQHGRFFAPRDGSEPSGHATRHTTGWPNYSDAFRVPVHLPSTSTGPAVLRKLEQARQVLGDGLPAWCDFFIVTSIGFVLDQSPLDLTGML